MTFIIEYFISDYKQLCLSELMVVCAWELREVFSKVCAKHFYSAKQYFNLRLYCKGMSISECNIARHNNTATIIYSSKSVHGEMIMLS